MKSTHIVLLASLIAVGGRWARHKSIDTSLVVGGIVVAIMITIMGDADEDFAEKFAWLVLFAVMGTNAEDLLKALGTATQAKGSNPGISPGGQMVPAGQGGIVASSGLSTGSSTFGK